MNTGLIDVGSMTFTIKLCKNAEISRVWGTTCVHNPEPNIQLESL